MVKLKKEENPKWLVVLEVLEKIAVIFTLIFSIYTLHATLDKESQIAEYQIEQERLPVLTALSQEIPVTLKRSSEGIVDFSSISGELDPIQIYLYNVGVGTAQNCAVTWDEESIQEACFQIENLLRQKSQLLIHEYSYSQGTSVLWHNYDYILEIDDNVPKTVSYWSSKEQERIFKDLSAEAIRLPYVLSVSVQDSTASISLPDGLSVLMLEAANQGITALPSLNLYIEYQDLAGNTFTKTLKTVFSLNEWEEISKDEIQCIYFISFQEL